MASKTAAPDLNWAQVDERFAVQRVTTLQWRAILLEELDRPIVRGHLRRVIGKRIGPGVYELRLEPLEARRG